MNLFDEKQKRKFYSNKLALLGLFFLLLVVFCSIFGYIIAPDHTQNANFQNINAAFLHPFTSVDYIESLRDEQDNQILISRLFFGSTQKKTVLMMKKGAEIKHGTLFYSKPKDHSGRLLARSIESIDREFGHHMIKNRWVVLGTDALGRDVLSRLIVGARVSLFVGVLSVLISLAIGVLLGAISGYFGGVVDQYVMWFVNVIWTVPTILFAMSLYIAFPLRGGYSLLLIFAAVGLTMWIDTARTIRGQFIQLKQQSFVEASHSLGYGNVRILFKHILPNTYTTLIVLTASNFASAILIESGMSYIGVGVQPPMPSWGSMMRDYYAYIGSDLSYLALFPGVCIMLTVFSFNMIGSGIRDTLDIKL